jgi:hypothetical protein
MSDPTDIFPDDLGDIEQMLRDLEPADLQLAVPPDEVWAGIAQQLAAELEAHSAVQQPVQQGLAPVVPLRRAHTHMRRNVLAIAAAAVLLIGAAVVVFANRGSDAVVLANATLTWDPAAFDPLGADASATAKLVEREGHYEIELIDADLPTQVTDTADLELWLIAVDEQGQPADIQPIDLVDPGKPGTYVVPDGVDPTVNTIVDISIEPRDGDAQHSGRSILRGPLESA